ncbi:pentapeptide repeat-containing protein [Congzhengia sp.]|uniref:pentapeptide repeat-containing protein n=1 Tax=Congzhengia sp. TaxID=2944168 RepID=UPI0030787641
MNILNPKVPLALQELTDFASAAASCMTEESPITGIYVADQTENEQDFFKLEVSGAVFERCTFERCIFEKTSFYDCKFQNCNFSNSNLQDAYFERCQFQFCKCIGTNFHGSVLKHVAALQSSIQFADFGGTKLTNVLFRETDLTESSFAESSLKQTEFQNSRLIKINFFKTPLAGIDFAKNEFAGPVLSSPPFELQGAKVNAAQAVDLARLLGVIVEDL